MKKIILLTFAVLALVVAPRLSFAASYITNHAGSVSHNLNQVQIGTKIYAPSDVDGIDVFDTTTKTLTHISTGFSFKGHPLVDGTNLYIPARDSLVVFDTVTNTVTANMPTPAGLDNVTPMKFGSLIYVASGGSNDLFMFDIATNGYVGAINANDIPIIGDFSKSAGLLVGSTYYLTLNGSMPWVAVFDLATNTYVGKIDFPNFGHQNTRPYFYAPTNRIFIPNAGDGIDVIDAATKSYIGNRATGKGYLNPGTVVGNKMYIGSYNGDIDVFDLDDEILVTTINTGGNTYLSEAVITPEGIVFPSANGTLDIVDPITNTVQSLTNPNGANYVNTNALLIDSKVYVPHNSSGIDEWTTALPQLLSFTTTTANGTYGEMREINITANFDQPISISIAGDGFLQVTLNTGVSIRLNQISGNQISGNYIVGVGQSTADLTVTAITDAGVGGVTSFSLPTAPHNLGNSSDIIINGSIIAACSAYAIANNVYPAFDPGNVVGNKLYTTHGVGQILSVWNTDTMSLVKQPNPVFVGGLGKGHTIGTKTYIPGGNGQPHFLIVDNTNDTSYLVPVPGSPVFSDGVQVGTKLYYPKITGTGDGILVFDTATETGTLISTPGLSFQSNAILVGTELYVPINNGSTGILVVDTTTDTVVRTIAAGGRVFRSPGVRVGDKLYFPDQSAGMTIVDTANSDAVTQVSMGTTFSPQLSDAVYINGKIYFATYSNGVVVFDPSTDTVETVVPHSSNWYFFNSDAYQGGRYLYFPSFFNGTAVFDMNTNTFMPDIPGNGYWRGGSVVGNKLFLPGYNDNNMMVIKLCNDTTPPQPSRHSPQQHQTIPMIQDLLSI